MQRRDPNVWHFRIDGSAHAVGDRALIFLFNPNRDALPGRLSLDERSTGLRGQGACRVAQLYPEAKRERRRAYGEPVEWDVPGRTAVVLEVSPEA